MRFLLSFLLFLSISFPVFAATFPQDAIGTFYACSVADLGDGTYDVYQFRYRVISYQYSSYWEREAYTIYLDYYLKFASSSRTYDSIDTLIPNFTEDNSEFIHPLGWQDEVSNAYLFAATPDEYYIRLSPCSSECEEFVPCVVSKFSAKFPFDLFANIPPASASCPKITLFEQEFDICWLYQALSIIKYPIIASLLLKILFLT